MALVTTFLTNIRRFVVEQDGDKLRDWLKVDQNAGAQYFQLARELQTGFRGGGKGLDQLIENALPEEDDLDAGRGSPWPGFVSFMKEYMQYWRDINFQDLIKCYERLSSLLT